MSLTKIGSIGINTGIQFAGVTTIATLNSSSNVLSVGGTVNFNSDVSIGGSVSIGGTLTYEDVTNIDSVGLVTARNGIVVGSGITLSKDGDGFFTGIVTATNFIGDGSNLTGISGLSVANQADNRLITATGTTDALNGEANLTFDGDTLLLKSSTDGRRVSFAGDGTSHYMKYDNTLGGIILNGYGGITFETNGTNERLRILSDGRIGINATTVFDTNTMLQVTGKTDAGPNLVLHRNDTSVSQNQVLAALRVTGNDSDGTQQESSSIEFVADADHGTGDKPGRLVFKTTNDGASSSTEKVRIDSSGNLLISTDNAHLRTGAGGDLQLYHDGSASVIKNITGDLYVQSIGDVKLRTVDSEIAVDCQANGAVHLHYDGASDSNLFTRYDGLTIRNNDSTGAKDCNVDMIGRVDGNVQLHFYADNSTDNNKKFKIAADSDGESFKLESYYTGSWGYHLSCTKGANSTSDRRFHAGDGGIRFDNSAHDYRDIDGDGHLFRRDGQAQLGVDDFFYIHDISNSENNSRLRIRLETNSGNIDAEGSINANQSLDFAEYFEWSDGNPSNEDRIGHTVSADGLTGKIKIAEEGETVIGVISGTAGYIGGGQAFSWQGRFKHDEWGREVYEEQKDENGNLIYADAETRAQIVKTERIETEEYNPSLENSYVPRELRKEWDVVGLVGQIRVRKTAVIPSNWVKLKEIDSVKDLYLVR